MIAEERTLSLRLAAETLVAEIARVLRPGGQVLACVDSLTFGHGVLAEQHRWPHLVDVPNADVVLIPWPDGTITRCYGAEQLRELFTGSGFEVSWIRPRTVLSPQTVSYLLARDPSRFGDLVNAELRRPFRRLGRHPAGGRCIKRLAPYRLRGRCVFSPGYSAATGAGGRALAWQGTHLAVAGRASSRRSGTGPAQSTHWP